VVFLLCLLLPVLGGIFYYVNQNNEEYTEETINTYLELGANVFDFTRQQQAYTLEAITASLTWDFGFRSAFAANDPATLFDAALNVLERSLGIADMLMVADLDNQVIIDTELQGGEMLTGTWLELVQEADASEEGIAEKSSPSAKIPFSLLLFRSTYQGRSPGSLAALPSTMDLFSRSATPSFRMSVFFACSPGSPVRLLLRR